jgi:hypothetical protein
MKCLHRRSFRRLRTAIEGIKGGTREIPYLAVGSKFHKQVGQI